MNTSPPINKVIIDGEHYYKQTEISTMKEMEPSFVYIKPKNLISRYININSISEIQFDQDKMTIKLIVNRMGEFECLESENPGLKDFLKKMIFNKFSDIIPDEDELENKTNHTNPLTKNRQFFDGMKGGLSIGTTTKFFEIKLKRKVKHV